MTSKQAAARDALVDFLYPLFREAGIRWRPHYDAQLGEIVERLAAAAAEASPPERVRGGAS